MADFRLLARTHGFMKLAEIVSLFLQVHFNHAACILIIFKLQISDHCFDVFDSDPHLLVEFRRRCRFGIVSRPLQCRFSHSWWYAVGIATFAHLLPVEHIGHLPTVPRDHLQHAGLHPIFDRRITGPGSLS